MTTALPIAEEADELAASWKVTLDTMYAPWLATADEDDPRPILTCVHIDPAGYAVASNGYLLAVVPCQIQPGLASDGVFDGVNIPAPLLKSAAAIAKRRKNPSYEIAIAKDQARSEFVGGGVWADLMPETYPNWRGLLPTEIGVSSSKAVDPALAVTLNKAVGGSGPLRWVSGPGLSALVMWGYEGSFGLVMPLNVVDDVSSYQIDLIQRARGPEVKDS